MLSSGTGRAFSDGFTDGQYVYLLPGQAEPGTAAPVTGSTAALASTQMSYRKGMHP